jgi:uncharacterized protein with NAD-binding domain and iron-sulfur cluster
MVEKYRVAILGGGPAGLSAAFHLTNDPEWKSKYDVCVYQLGWRLGGKGATGRNPKQGWRIEEHGIHGFCKFYFNTWSMMSSVYKELKATDRAVMPCKKMETAFLPSSISYSVSNVDKTWHSDIGHMPTGDGLPWDSDDVELSWKAIILGIFEQMMGRGRKGNVKRLGHSDLLHPKSKNERNSAHASAMHRLIKSLHKKIDKDWKSGDEKSIEKLLTSAVKDLSEIRKPLGGFIAEVEKIFHIGNSQALTTLDMFWAVLVGIVKDELWRKDLDVVDHLDYRAWLKTHGAKDHTLTSVLAFAVPNILFAYPDGDSTRPPTLSTAAWLNWTLRSVLGKGDYFYFMASGTGDTVISPLYLTLLRRGVRFEFFHKLTGIETVKDEGDLCVQKLIFEKQAEQSANKEYDPLVKMPAPKGWKVWPSEPKWASLKDSNKDKSDNINFESWDGPSGCNARVRTLTKGIDGTEGFDYAIWAMPTSLIPLVGDASMKELWKSQVEKLPTTMTQAAQFWMNRSTDEMGWKIPKGDPATSRYVSASMPNPLNGMADFSDLIRFEHWVKTEPKALIYFCSQLQSIDNSHDEDLARVKANLSSSLRLLGNFLPDGRPAGLERNDSQEIDFSLLSDEDRDNKGMKRLGYQYVRANTDPTEAYVQAVPGGAGARLMPWASGFKNLVPAGDWIYTGFNLGSFESAVTGGKLAAFALTGTPDYKDIPGFTFLHPDAETAASKALVNGDVPVIEPRR